ncbi:hypothetical protein BCR33DRAFT_738196 [Rhizoclosmatium globosum]|uniref:Uncharacterized protein n=1 Tax=Rhizoclosmatium globosum TaxID=329046 RepID=A0A1Y2CAF3_9FUNG|nr:hypothetical protein BCR33DRAFT_738196 [Rhizoclosmatium globosum]|eukprot:ORY44012.1 hypothetical protein BCR33DRAFT_738196 [Rhizoclosmatium globosum]
MTWALTWKLMVDIPVVKHHRDLVKDMSNGIETLLSRVEMSRLECVESSIRTFNSDKKRSLQIVNATVDKLTDEMVSRWKLKSSVRVTRVKKSSVRGSQDRRDVAFLERKTTARSRPALLSELERRCATDVGDLTMGDLSRISVDQFNKRIFS